MSSATQESASGFVVAMMYGRTPQVERFRLSMYQNCAAVNYVSSSKMKSGTWAPFQSSTVGSCSRCDILPLAPRGQTHSWVFLTGRAPSSGKTLCDSSQSEPGFVMSGIERRKKTAEKPGTSLCRAAASISAKLLPQPAAPPPIVMSARDERNFVWKPACGPSVTGASDPGGDPLRGGAESGTATGTPAAAQSRCRQQVAG